MRPDYASAEPIAAKPIAQAERRQRPLRILSLTTLYPSASRPNHGVFVENRLRQLVASGEVDLRVVAPVPWFPLHASWLGDYARHARTPGEETRHGIAISHPRYPVLPRIGMSIAPFLLEAALRGPVTRLLQAWGGCDLIDAHYFYPDGVAAVLLGLRLGKPVVVTARGTDLNLLPRYAVPRRLIRWAAGEAAGLITVCQALKTVLVELGVPAERVVVLRNGVDLLQFSPGDREAARAALGLTRPTLVSAGLLIERKGHDLVIAALAELPGFELLIAGEGPERGALERLARVLGVAERVRFLGAVPHERMPDLYRAADILVLASSREGWANVLLEALACGTPVVASKVWGTPEVVAAPAAGVLMEQHSAAGVAQAVARLWSARPERAATRGYAEGFSWEATTRGQLALFRSLVPAA